MRAEIDAAVKAAMKAGDKRRVGTLRMVAAAIKDKDIAVRGEGREKAGEEELLQLLAKMIKQREDSAAAYDAGARPELAAGEREEIAIIREFMPAQLGAEETEAVVAAIVAELGLAGPADMGKAMAALKSRHAGRIDMGKANALVKAALKG